MYFHVFIYVILLKKLYSNKECVSYDECIFLDCDTNCLTCDATNCLTCTEDSYLTDGKCKSNYVNIYIYTRVCVCMCVNRCVYVYVCVLIYTNALLECGVQSCDSCASTVGATIATETSYATQKCDVCSAGKVTSVKSTECVGKC